MFIFTATYPTTENTSVASVVSYQSQDIPIQSFRGAHSVCAFI